MGNGVEKKKKAKSEGSLKAGFILVGIGLVFLMSNLANIPISKTWPLFLIIVGASLLIGALKDRNAPRFDCVLARAVGQIAMLVESSGHLLVGGGRLLAMKGKRPDEELKSLPTGWKVAEIHKLVVPGLDEERHLVEIWRSHDK